MFGTTVFVGYAVAIALTLPFAVEFVILLVLAIRDRPSRWPRWEWLLYPALEWAFLIEDSFGSFFATPFLLLGFVHCGLVAVAFLLLGDRSQLAKAVARCGWMVLIVASFLFLDRAQMACTRSEGDRILAAVDRYRIENGNPPARLEDLVPAYVDSVPRPCHGGLTWRPAFSFVAFPSGHHLFARSRFWTVLSWRTGFGWQRMG